MTDLFATMGRNNRPVDQHQVDPGFGRRRSFRKFPFKNSILKQWLQNLKQEAWITPTGHHILRWDPFTDDCFETGMEV